MKANHCLKGGDVLPVVLRLREVDESMEANQMACFVRKYSLGSYLSEDLGRAVKFDWVQH